MAMMTGDEVTRCLHGVGFFTVTVFRVDFGERDFDSTGPVCQ